MTTGYRLRGGTLAAVALALSLCACGTVNRFAVRSAEFQDKSRRPAPSETRACSLANQEVAELDRQITRLSGLITTATTAIQELRSSRDHAVQTGQSCLEHCNDLSSGSAVKECIVTCARITNGPVTAAQESLTSRQQSCQQILQSIQALNGIRADLARTCPIRFGARDIPAATVCN
jgi:hypothetical protein